MDGMANTFRYDGSDIRQLMERIEQGDKAVCHRCGAELIVALDEESIAKYKTHPGVYCPKRHIWDLVELRSPDHNKFWDQFKK